MLKKLLFICASVLSVEAASTSIHLTDFTAEQKQNALLFEGHDTIDLETLELIRPFFHLKREEIVYLTPELTERYQAACKRVCEKMGVSYSEDFTLLDVLFIPLRKMLETSKPTEDEALIFDATPLGEFYRSFLKNAHRSSPTKLDNYAFLKSIKHFNRDHYDARFKTLSPLRKAFYKQNRSAYIPVYEKTELGFALLISCMLDNVYPVALGKGGGRAHGVDFSDFGFSLHDIAHGLVLDSFQQEIRHVQMLMDIWGSKGYTAQDIIEVYTPILLKKYALHQETYHQLLKDLVGQNDVPSIIALFLMSHESTLKRNYATSDLKTAFGEASDQFKKGIGSLFKSVSFGDMKDSQIIWTILEKTFPEENARRLERDSLARYTIERNPRYVTVPQLHRKDGTISVGHLKKKRYKTKLQNRYDAEDLAKVLRIADIEVSEKDDIDVYLESVKSGLGKLMEHFDAATSRFAESHGDAYAKKFEALEAELSKGLKAYETFDPKFTMTYEHQYVQAYEKVKESDKRLGELTKQISEREDARHDEIKQTKENLKRQKRL